jgi:Fur family ferric uptake transcriptional regulator
VIQAHRARANQDVTLHHSAAPVRVETLAAAIGSLRNNGLRVSTARRLVLGALFAAERPVSAHEIADATGGDVASVYRNLETLEQVGLARHCHLGHGPGMYELAGRPRRDYLVCEVCGDVRAAEPGALADVRADLLDRLGFEPRFDHFPLIGVCSRCCNVDAREAPLP